ncbi:MAG: sugar kinase [Elusimicrobia bacterium]|nr:sugar kinase [Elusimicrobiota bacterium]
MNLLVVGSVGLDTVKTPFGAVKEALGGSATYFAYAASFFAPVRLVGVVGEDFPQEHLTLLRQRGVHLDGLEVAPGRTFRWQGSYEYDLNEAHTLATELNVFETFQPKIPTAYQASEFVFLANINPELQLEVLTQVKAPRLIACDTMNLWIRTKREPLLALLKQVHIFILNDGEARQLTQQSSLIKAGRLLLQWGPRVVVIKKGEHGVLLFTQQDFFAAPAFPLEEVYDPTGAGDCFAGGFFGSLARHHHDQPLTTAALRQAVIFGSVLASFNVERFSLERLTSLTLDEIQTRYRQFSDITHFSPV